MANSINIIHCSIFETGKRLSRWLVPSEAYASRPNRVNGLPEGQATQNNSAIFIVCDRNVNWVVEKTGLKPTAVLEIEASEQAKSLDTVLEIDRWLMEQGADRNAFVMGIGGGITTDMVGFAASVYKRGVRFGFIPTTLLSQVDAAIGGKNGVNLDSYKNMIGVFRQPEMTFICPEPLETLPYSQIVSGAAELLKTFIIDNEGDNYEKAVALLSEIQGKPFNAYSKALNDLVAAAAMIKAGIAGRDPEEHGERRLLNLGHTFAHAIEKKSGESISHGNAVAMGMIMAARLAEKTGLAKSGFTGQLEKDFKACGLPIECPIPVTDLADAMNKDKKAEGSVIHFVLPLAIGHVETRDFDTGQVVKLLED